MKKFNYIITLFFIFITLNHSSYASNKFITLQSTTSTRDSGLYNYLLPIFEKELTNAPLETNIPFPNSAVSEIIALG